MEKNNDEKNLPVMMYIHGFMSGGAHGSKQKALQKQFKGRYRVIAPELDADPDKSLNILNEVIKQEKPEIIIGTSLGGWMTLKCESIDAELVVVNPVVNPYNTLAQWLNKEQTYFCPRLDGIQTYTLTQETLDRYKNGGLFFELLDHRNRIHALCSTKDELLGREHIESLCMILPEDRLMIVDDFPHQCRDAGLKHLYEILENIIKEKRHETD